MEKKYALSVWLNLNRSCNMRCSYCYLNGRHSVEPLSSDQLETVYNFVRKTPVYKYTLLGGEIFLEKKALFTILDIIAENNKNNTFGNKTTVSFITNGTIYFDELKNYDFITSIQISYDGPTQDINRKFLGGAVSSEVIKDNIKKFRELEIPVYLHSVLAKDTYKDFFKIADEYFTNWPYKDMHWNFGAETMFLHPKDAWSVKEYYSAFNQLFQLSKKFPFIDFFSFGGSVCAGGATMLMLDGATGDIFGCENLLNTDLPFVGKIGSLHSNPVVSDEVIKDHLTVIQNTEQLKKIKIKFLPRFLTKKIIKNTTICWAENICYNKDPYIIPLYKIVNYILRNRKIKWRKAHGLS